MAFLVEEITDTAILFRRIHQMHRLADGGISSAAYDKDNLSVNWKKYSEDPASSADEKSAYVTSLICKQCRDLEQKVEHKPIEPEAPHGPNQAHSEIIGNKKRKQIKQKLRDAAQIVWTAPENP